MPSSKVEFRVPMKGVNRDAALHSISPDYALDAQNVVPFNAQNRQRMTQRAGTAKLFTNAAGDGNPVRAMAQVPAANVDASSPVLLDSLDYPDGSAWSAVAAEWSVSFVGDNSEPTIVDGALPLVTPQLPSTVVTANWFAEFTDTVATFKAFTISTEFLWTNAPSNGSDAITLEVGAKKSDEENFVIAVVTATDDGTQQLLVTDGANTSDPVDVTLTEGVTYRLVYSGTATTARGRLVGSNGDTWATSLLTNPDIPTYHLDTAWSAFSVNYAAAIVPDSFATLQNLNLYTKTGRLVAQKRVFTAGGHIYLDDLDGSLPTPVAADVLNVDAPISVAYSTGKVYFVDGTHHLQVLDIEGRAAADIVPEEGSETATTLGKYTIAAMYRDRLVLAGNPENPQNFIASRVGDHLDWDYGQDDPAGAFAGNASQAGRVGDPVLALMPASDDVMYIGGDHSLWAMRGDIADGGSIDVVSTAVGIMSNTAWTKSPDGTIYFAGTGGLFRLAGTNPPVNISTGRITRFFADIDRTASDVHLVWDQTQQGLYVFVTPNSGTTTAMFYDQRTDGFYPLLFPDTHGPNSVLLFDGDLPNDRLILLGGRDGFIRYVSPAATTDDGNAIESFINFVPVSADAVTESTLQWMDVIFGEESNFNVTLTALAGPTVDHAFSTPRRSINRTYTAGRRPSRWLMRTRGVYHALRFSNSVINKTWSLEQVAASFNPGGHVAWRT